MVKQVGNVGKGNKAAKAAAVAPSAVVVVQPNPATVLAQALAVAAQAAAPAATVGATPQPTTVALRGRLAFSAIGLHPTNVYHVGAAHNVAWWRICTQLIAQGNGTATVAAIVAQGVPATFIGYVVRRNYAVAA